MVFLQTGARRLTAVGNLGFTGTDFGILLYALPSKDSTAEITFGLGTDSLDNSVAGSVNKHWNWVFFDTITQTNSYATYYYLKFRMV